MFSIFKQLFTLHMRKSLLGLSLHSKEHTGSYFMYLQYLPWAALFEKWSMKMMIEKHLPASSFKLKHLSYARKCNLGPVAIKPVHYLHWSKSHQVWKRRFTTVPRWWLQWGSSEKNPLILATREPIFARYPSLLRYCALKSDVHIVLSVHHTCQFIVGLKK